MTRCTCHRGFLQPCDYCLSDGPEPDSKPVRVQLSRKKGWKLPPNTVVVSRPSNWGNPYRAQDVGSEKAVQLFRNLLTNVIQNLDYLEPLRGKNLACWCKIGEPCHADVLLELANAD